MFAKLLCKCDTVTDLDIGFAAIFHDTHHSIVVFNTVMTGYRFENRLIYTSMAKINL